MAMVAISDVKVVDRHRVNLGDLEALAGSLKEIGQLQPIVVTADLRLVAGGRRLAAAESIGWVEIEAKVVDRLDDAAALLRAERDENTCRKAFTPTEEHSLYEALLVFESPSGNESQIVASGRAKQSVAEIVTGNAGRYKTLEKVGEVKRVAFDEGSSQRLRETAREALIEMDRTGNISGPYMRVSLAERAASAKARDDFAAWSHQERMLMEQLREGQTVVVSLREHHENLVRWVKAEGLLEAVDRRTEWGNPFEMPFDGDRATVIRNYAEHYLPNKPSLLGKLPELKGKALACWCAPASCHADTLKALVDDQAAS